MKFSLTTKTWLLIAAVMSLLLFAAKAKANDPTDFLAQSFPEKVGSFARISATRNAAAIRGDVIDAAVAKYATGANEIEWTGTAFSTSESAFAALEALMNSYQRPDIRISSVKNSEGKVRYAVIETPEKIICGWVNKKRRNLFFVATGKMPEIETFMRLQSTW